MDVLLIGNGLDLHFCLPTNYNGFLRVSEHILHLLKEGEEEVEETINRGDSDVEEEKCRKRIKYVAQVLGDKSLLDSDKCLKNCLERYGADYDTPLDTEEIEGLFGHLSSNMWFNYLIKSINPKDKWIDFEREIGYVISALKKLLTTFVYSGNDGLLFVQEKSIEHICNFFPFFADVQKASYKMYNNLPTLCLLVKDEFMIEEPFGSGRFLIDKRKIASTLFEDLRKLADTLHGYLKWFVERPLIDILQKGCVEKDQLLSTWQWTNTKVISFNYTHTLDDMFDPIGISPSEIYHVHGEIEGIAIDEGKNISSSSIVLGINSDKSDELDDLDVSFIQFKKFFQRVFFGTDLGYLDFMNRYEEKESKEYNLYVIGHSLDATDKEVIQECFYHASRIFVFYHSEKSLADYVRNLVSIFGKKSFDALRNERKLRFIDMNIAMRMSRKDFEKTYY